MDRELAIKILEDYKLFDSGGMSIKEIDECKKHNEAIDLAIEALEREIEYGQMVVDYTKGEALKSGDWEYTNTPTDIPTNDCISRQRAIEEIKNATTIIGWNKYVSQEEIVDDVERQLRRLFVGAIKSLPQVTPPKRVLAEIKVDTEEVVERIKEEFQLEQEHGRLIDADKLLQDLFTVEEEEWTTPEIRAILENAPTVITPTERTGEWVEDGYYDYPYYVCSNCGQKCGTQSNGVEIEPLCTKYCPNCGAKMKE